MTTPSGREPEKTEAADRLERPHFTAEQVEAASKEVEASWNTGYRSFFFLARAALSAIGTVEGEG